MNDWDTYEKTLIDTLSYTFTLEDAGEAHILYEPPSL